MDRVGDQMARRQVVHRHRPEELRGRQIFLLEVNDVRLRTQQLLVVGVHPRADIHGLFLRIAVDAHRRRDRALHVVAVQVLARAEDAEGTRGVFFGIGERLFAVGDARFDRLPCRRRQCGRIERLAGTDANLREALKQFCFGRRGRLRERQQEVQVRDEIDGRGFRFVPFGERGLRHHRRRHGVPECGQRRQPVAFLDRLHVLHVARTAERGAPQRQDDVGSERITLSMPFGVAPFQLGPTNR